MAVSYIKGLGAASNPLLIILAAVKFFLVGSYFMHLRFDNKIFRTFFTTGLILACFVYPIMLTTFHFWAGG